MTASTSSSATDFSRSETQRSSLRLILVVAVAIYAGAYLLSFLASPLGRIPLLDGAENVELATQIAQGNLPHEPFYRAMLYPALLSLFLRAGMAPASLPIAAGILGLLFHLGSTVCVYHLANRLWSNPRAGFLAAVLFGFNPVAIYFSAELLDTTFGLFLFLAGLNTLHAALCVVRCRAFNSSGEDTANAAPGFSSRKLLAGICGGTGLWTLAMLARPHYAVLLVALPFLLAASLWWRRRLLAWSLGLSLFTAGVLLGLTGLAQKSIGGSFRIMPTQGAYSLWVGNRPGANGRYFEQQFHIPAGTVTHAENPARIESEFLYRQQTGESGVIEADKLNRYWKTKTVAAIHAAPMAWIQLMLRKTYYLFNDFEQYNNKTFAVQKHLSQVLRFNLLGWGVTFILCGAGLVCARLLGRPAASGWLLSAVAALYGAGVVLFFVSDRFRLPLLPLICIGAGSCVFATQKLFTDKHRLVWSACGALAVALMTFSRAWGVHDLSPVVQDYLLLSMAAEKCGEDLEALRWARRALEVQPEHPDALACAVTSFFNAKLQGKSPEVSFPDETWAHQCERVGRIPQPASGVRLVQAVALWKTGQATRAQSTLQALLDEKGQGTSNKLASDDFLGVLLLTGMDAPGDEARARNRADDTASFYLVTALERRRHNIAANESRHQLAVQAEPFVRNIFP